MIEIIELEDDFSYIPLKSFETLKSDKYLKVENIFRRRAYSSGVFEKGKMNWKTESSFVQLKELNSYAGDIVRQFEPLTDECKKYTELLVDRILKISKIPDDNYEIGSHQIRVLATNNFNGYPAPEGFHQDGFDYIAIQCVDLKNVNGAVSLVRPIKAKSDKSLYEYILAPRQIMVLNDREVEHYVTPLTPKVPGSAHRDIFVITFSKIKDF